MADFWTLTATGSGELKLIDRKQVEEAAYYLFGSDSAVQIQGLPSAAFRIVFSDDIGRIVEAVEYVAAGNSGVYFSLNPLNRGCIGPSKNGDVSRRRWVLVDCDPVRPHKSNSTDEEHDASLETASRIMDGLLAEGWPLPFVCDSGNGTHLLYRIDLPNDDDSKVVVKQFLKALAERYDNEAVKVDKQVYDAKRICKLPGTLTRKGDATPDRPHRWAKIRSIPGDVEVVSLEQLKSVGAWSKEEPKNLGHVGHVPVPQSVWLLSASAERKAAYAKQALDVEMARLAAAPQGERNSTLNDVVFRLGTLVGAGALTADQVTEAAMIAASRCGLLADEKKQTENTIKRAIRDGAAKPRDLAFLDAERNCAASGHAGAGTPPTSANGTHKVPAQAKPPKIIRADELMETEFAPARWAVPGILCEGLSILAGKPKLGKSWMALNMGLTIAGGGMALGSAQTQQGDVLYLALEDRPRRIQARIKKMKAGLDVPWNKHLGIATEWPKQLYGGVAYIGDWLKQSENPRLVIIDVWARFRLASSGRRNAYDEDYEAAGELKAMLDEHNCSGLLLHHCKKGKAEDVVEEVSGTLGLAGAADGVLVLARSRGENEGVLHITGRDVEEQQLALRFEPETCCWFSEGSAAAKVTGRIRSKITSVFKAHPGGKYQPGEMAMIIEENEESVRKELWRMKEDQILGKVGKAYTWPLDDLEDRGEAF